MGAAMTSPVAYGDERSLGIPAHDDDAFRSWYDATLPRVYRYLLARCGGDPALAEELTQQTFVEALRNRRRFDGRADVVTWLVAIGRHKLIDHFRRAGRDRQRHLRLVSRWGYGEGGWDGAEERQAINAALDQLSGEHRIALLLRYLDGLSVREVARALGRSESATESLLVRAREAFRHAYGDPGHG